MDVTKNPPDRFTTDLTHDVTFTTQVLVAEAEEVIDDKSLIAITECVKIDIVAVIVKE
jgi:hypothetical protein